MVTVSKLVSQQTFLKSTEEPQRQELCHPPYRGWGPLPSEGLPGRLAAQPFSNQQPLSLGPWRCLCHLTLLL